ncbi:acyl carrier protein [Macellibacteroides fermentans]|uniref:acyl carrier protein n=1 Tax=Macellibacteroides fermentans TaxID=879969 RepID=UPI00352DF2F0
MEINDFISKFASQFDETDAAEFTAETVFKDLAEWSSLMSLSIIAMADEEYSVKVKGDDIKNAATIQDLFEVVVSRMN